MKKSDVVAPGWRSGVLLKPGEKPGKVLRMRLRMAKNYVPWGEIVLLSVLGGFVVLGVAIVGLWLYRWALDAQALVTLNGDEQNLYVVIAFGIGFVITAVALAITTAKKSGSGIVSLPEKKRPGSSRLEDKWRRRS
ncbi:MAG: hypothetical protein ROO76_11880 [Terriglobia bacterium]|nr:hypothetical protein [Terriglobia bacterium]